MKDKRLQGEGAEEEEDWVVGKRQREGEVLVRIQGGITTGGPYLYHIQSGFGTLMGQVCPAPVSSLGEAATQWCSGLSLGHCSLSLSVFLLMAQRADWVLFCLLSFCHPLYSGGYLRKKYVRWWEEEQI